MMMSAKRNLSAVSAKSGSATFAHAQARILGIDGGGRKDLAKMKSHCRSMSPSLRAVERPPGRALREFRREAVERVLPDMENYRIKRT